MAVIAAIALWLGVFFAVAGAIGVWAMRDALQRLHYLSLPCSLSTALVTLALLLHEKDKLSVAKPALAMLVIFAVNAVVTQATARAIRVRECGRWPPPEGK